MLREQEGNSRWGKWSGGKEKKKDEEKIKGAKKYFLFAAKTKRNQIDLHVGWNKLTWFGNKLTQGLIWPAT